MPMNQQLTVIMLLILFLFYMC